MALLLAAAWQLLSAAQDQGSETGQQPDSGTVAVAAFEELVAALADGGVDAILLPETLVTARNRSRPGPLLRPIPVCARLRPSVCLGRAPHRTAPCTRRFRVRPEAALHRRSALTPVFRGPRCRCWIGWQADQCFSQGFEIGAGSSWLKKVPNPHSFSVRRFCCGVSAGSALKTWGGGTEKTGLGVWSSAHVSRTLRWLLAWNAAACSLW